MWSTNDTTRALLGRYKVYVVVFCVTAIVYVTFTMLGNGAMSDIKVVQGSKVTYHNVSNKNNSLISNRQSIRNYKNTENKDRNKDVLLFAYMRSGSTLMGQFFRNSPGTFYVFEPLAAILPYHYLTENEVCNMRDAECRPMDRAEWVRNQTRFQEAIRTIANIYSCRIRNIPEPVINQILSSANKSSNAWVDLGKCLNSSQLNPIREKEKCFDQIELACKSADIKVIKVLRLGFTHMRYLLDSIHSLDILFLHRDPRAILNSRISTDWFPVSEENFTEVKDNVDSLCKKMNDDLASYKDMRASFNDRILQVSLENITDSKQGMLNILYHFRPNYVLQSEDKAFIDRVFTKKKNGVLFRNWEQTLKVDFKRLIDDRCAFVLSYLNKHS